MVNIIDPNGVVGKPKANPATKLGISGEIPAVVLTVDSTLFKFYSVDEFSAAIDGRTAISAELYANLSAMSGDELTLLANDLKQEEKRLIELLERALTSPGVLSTEINRIPLASLRNEHYWRDIIISLCDLDANEVYLQTAIVKYLQFLNSYQETIRIVYALIADKADIGSNRDVDEVAQASFETALFDITQYNDAGRMINPFRRLPQGEAVTLHALPGHAITLLLAKYTFELVNRNGWRLVDSKGGEYTLTNDLNYVGRGRENDISLGGEYRNVSRKHVIVHPLDDSSVVLIDLSSHGTFVPPRQVDLSPRH